MLVFLNGQFVAEEQAVVPVSDRGFLLGDGLFETMRVVHGRPFRIAQHLNRLACGADFLKIKIPFTPQELEQFATQLIERNQMPDGILRLTLTRGPGGRGYAPSVGGKPTVVMTLHAAPGAPNSGSAQSRDELKRAELEFGAPICWNLITSSFRIPAVDPLASFKTTSKIWHVMARAEAVDQGADEALLLNTNGEVAETAGGNLFWIEDGEVCTVPAGHGILPGVTRGVVLELCQTLGWQSRQRVIKTEALVNTTGLFVTQSVLGIVPVAALDDRPMPPSSRVATLTRAYSELLNQP